jgi:hypothetical protein
MKIWLVGGDNAGRDDWWVEGMLGEMARGWRECWERWLVGGGNAGRDGWWVAGKWVSVECWQRPLVHENMAGGWR